MKRDVIKTDAAPGAVGPYSQAVRTGNLVFCSGQIPIDPATGEFAGSDIESQTRQCMENLKAVLEKAGSSFDNCVKMQIYLTDMGDFDQVNRVYGSYFSHEPPARACVAVAALPKGARVEIEAIGIVE
jgi:2-iminobutanoate/2-iminopropanoate deaminase